MNSDEKKKALVLALGVAGIVGLAIRGFTQSSKKHHQQQAGRQGSQSPNHSLRRSSGRGGSGSRIQSGTRQQHENTTTVGTASSNTLGNSSNSLPVSGSPNSTFPSETRRRSVDIREDGGNTSTHTAPAPVVQQQHPSQQQQQQPQPFSESPFTGNNSLEDGGSGFGGEGPESELELQFRLDGFRLRSPGPQAPNRPFGSTAGVPGAAPLPLGGGSGGTAGTRTSGHHHPHHLHHHHQHHPLDDPDGTFSYEDSVTSARLGSGEVSYKKGRRNTVVGHSTNLDETRMYQPTHQPKTQAEKDQLFAALTRCHLFAHLDEDEVNQVLEVMERCHFSRGEYVTKAGEVTELDSHKFFVLLEGEISVIEHNTVVRVLSSGSCFGESHIMFIQPRFMWTHRVDTNTALCFSLDATAYRHIVTRAAVNKRELYEGFLDRVSWLKGLDRREKLQLADCLQPVVYPDGHYLIEYNTLGEWVFIILEGTVDVFGRDERGEVLNVCSFAVGDCVGELEFINHHRTVADVRAKGRVKAARLHREHFEMCMGPIVDVLQRTAVADPRYAYYQTRIRTMRRPE